MVPANLLQVEDPWGGRAASLTPSRPGAAERVQPGGLQADLSVCGGRCPASAGGAVETSRGVCRSPINGIKLFHRAPHPCARAPSPSVQSQSRSGAEGPQAEATMARSRGAQLLRHAQTVCSSRQSHVLVAKTRRNVSMTERGKLEPSVPAPRKVHFPRRGSCFIAAPAGSP